MLLNTHRSHWETQETAEAGIWSNKQSAGGINSAGRAASVGGKELSMFQLEIVHQDLYTPSRLFVASEATGIAQ